MSAILKQIFQTCSGTSGSMQVEVDTTSSTINGNQMVVENDNENHEISENNENNDIASQSQESQEILKEANKLTQEDLSLLCDLFYLPFEHGGQGIQLLQEFNWLKSNAQIVIHKSKDEEPSSKPDVSKLFQFKNTNM